MTQENSKKWEDSFIVHHRNHDRSDDKLTNEHEHAELISRMCMQAIWKELSYHTMLQMLRIWLHD